VREIRHRVDIHTLGHQRASDLQLNEIGVVSVEAQRPVFFDAYGANRSTGSFILIDPITNETLGAGMIIGPDTWRPSGPVTPAERLARIGHRPYLVRLLSADSETARGIERHLFDQGYLVHVVVEPQHLAQAVRTAFTAGLVTLVYGAVAQNSAALSAGIPAEQIVILDRAQFEDETALIRALMQALTSTASGNVPLTDGAGI
jgi:hypothetical protein